MTKHAGFGLLIAALALGACTLDRSGTGLSEDAFKAEPNYICAGETVTLSWDRTDLPRNRENCAMPDGGFDPRRTCSASSECGADGECLDGLCIRDGVDRAEVDFGAGCFPDTFTTVNGAPPVTITPPIASDRAVRGRREVEITETTDFTATLFSNPPRSLRAVGQLVTVVDTERSTPIILEYPLTCSSAGQTLVVNLARLPGNPVRASDRVQVIRTTNLSGFPITVGADDPVRGPANLPTGAATGGLNGPARGNWTASGMPGSGAPFPIPGGDCVTEGGTILPPIRVRLDLACVDPLGP